MSKLYYVFKYTKLSKISTLVLVCFFLFSCAENKLKTPKAVLNNAIEVDLIRFDYDFAKADSTSLQQLKQKYPLLLSNQYDDQFWKAKMLDTLQQELSREVINVYPKGSGVLKKDITLLFKHISHYYPETKLPKVYTVTSNVDYKTPVLWVKDRLLIALDTYLGSDHYFYEGIPKYVSKKLKPQYVAVDIAQAFVAKRVLQAQSNSFLEVMINEGKQLYAMRELLSDRPLMDVLKYDSEALLFAAENEKNIWAHFVNNEMLYDTSVKLKKRFIDPAPFSKFYLELDAETPGRIGRFIGYQIVKSYMEHNNTTTNKMLQLDAQTLFNNAQYKP